MHQIGVGVLGPVFRTYEPTQDRLYAVKAFHADITPEQAQTLVELLTRLVSAGLSHPAIVAPVAAGLEEDVPYLAQEYVAAESLDVAMRHYTPATFDTTVPLIEQLAEALDVAHGRGVVHGGLHLRDVLVTGDEVHATGFGVIAALEEIGLRGPIRRPYTAPEMIAGRQWGPEADRFALAAIAYELLTGKRAAGTGLQVRARLDGVEGVADAEALQMVFATALAALPDDRYSSATEFASALRAAVGEPVDLGLGEAEGSGLGGTAASRTAAPVDLLSGLDLHREPLQQEFQDDEPILGPLPPDDVGDVIEDGEAVDIAPDATTDSPVSDELLDMNVDAPVGFDGDQQNDDHDLPLHPVDQRQAEFDESRDAVEELAELADGEPNKDDIWDDEAAEAMVELTGPLELGEPRVDVEDPAALLLADESDEPDLAASIVAGVAAGEHENARGGAWSARRVLLLAAVVAISAIAAYFVGLGLGSSDQPGDGLGTQGAADPASRDWSGAEVGAVEGGTASAPVAAARAGRVEEEPRLEPDTEPDSIPAPPVLSAPAASVPVGRDVAPPSTEVEPEPHVDAEAGSGWILVRTTPPGAIVTVGGVERGQTPLSLSGMPYGTHSVEVSRSGFRSQAREVIVSSSAAVAAVGIELSPRAASPATSPVVGSMFVESRPPGARVVVDGRTVGTTPTVVSDVAIGRHLLRLERDGYQAWVTTVDVSSGQVRVAASLDQISRR